MRAVAILVAGYGWVPLEREWHGYFYLSNIIDSVHTNKLFVYLLLQFDELNRRLISIQYYNKSKVATKWLRSDAKSSRLQPPLACNVSYFARGITKKKIIIINEQQVSFKMDNT